MYKERTNPEWLDLKGRQIERFKIEFERQKAMRGGVYKRCELAHELGISGEDKTSSAPITNYFGRSSTKPFPYYEELAHLWGVRREYLECKDTFRTNADLYKYQKQGDKQYKIDCKKYVSCMDNWIRLIEMLEYTVEIKLELYVPSWKELAAQWDAIKLTLTDETLKQPINAGGQTFNDWDGKTPIDNKYLCNIWVKQTLSGSDTDHYGLDADSKYSLYFVLMKDGKQAFWNVSDLDTVTEKIYEYAEFVAGKAFSKNIWNGDTYESRIAADQTQEGRHGDNQ